ncbi:MAG: hypothetical protein V1897_19985, partial [Pseudomonadota bacterium]
MTLSPSTLEQIAAWCATSDSLADIRSAARNEYFGYDEPGEVHYMEGAGRITSRERRFLSWFALTYRLKDGHCPAELATEAFFNGDELVSVIDSIRKSQYVLAMVAMVIPGRGLILKLGDEEFEIDNHQLSRMVNRDDSLYAHIIPARRHGWMDGWLVGPGWLQWPIRIMPGMQAALKDVQLTPIEVERFLQQRKDSSKDRPKEEMPRDSSLKTAVARMTKTARTDCRHDLIMTPTQWKELVLSQMKSSNVNGFISLGFGHPVVSATGRRSLFLLYNFCSTERTEYPFNVSVSVMLIRF